MNNPPINQQTPGPLSHGGNLVLDIHGNSVAACYSYGAGIVPQGYTAPWHLTEYNSALITSAYTAFDKAGRKLGIDANELAQGLDLTALIRAACSVTRKAYQERRDHQCETIRACIDELDSTIPLPVKAAEIMS